MDDLLIVGGALALLLLWKGGGSAALTVSPNASPNGLIPTALSISGGPLVSGGYQIAPASNVGAGLAPATPSNLPTFVPPAPGAAPPPPYVGGAAGTVGTGGIGLGGFRIGQAPLMGSGVPGWASWLVRHRVPDNHFGRPAAGLSRVPVVFG